MRPALCTSLLMALVLGCSPPPEPGDAGTTTELGETSSTTDEPPVLDPTVDAEFERMCEEREPALLGGVLAVVGSDGVHRYGTCGYVDRAHTRDVVLSDRFRVASVTKMFMSALSLVLVDEGAISLDDTVASFGVVTDAADTIRVRHLLDHTSGLVDYNFAAGFDWSRSWTIPEIIAWATDTYEPSFAADTNVGYSGTGYQVLSEIIAAEGRPGFVEALRSRILTPLGLTDTFLEGGEPIPGGRVEGSRFFLGPEPEPPEVTNDWASADGSMVSSAPDLLTFMEHLFVAKDLVSEAGVAAMTTQATLADGTPVVMFDDPTLPYGLGVFIEDAEGGPIYWHTGTDYGFRSYAGIQPATGRAVVVLLNSESLDPSRIADEAWDLAIP
jgi:D-alanyl-D-alanine carboxypeptidase